MYQVSTSSAHSQSNMRTNHVATKLASIMVACYSPELQYTLL